MRWDHLAIVLFVAQAILGLRVIRRLVRAGGASIRAESGRPRLEGSVSVLVPVLDERRRLAPCLEGLLAQGPEVGEILVVDGGSLDGTQALIEKFAARDGRVRLVDASPVPPDWNGKAWGLQIGFERAMPAAEWVLTIDADVRPRAPLTRALLARARHEGLAALSVATLQELAGAGEGLVHPSMLATLVYRFGTPGRVYRNVAEVQANGQCFLFRRDVLARAGGFRAARFSRSEDHTIARTLIASGHPVGFYETDGLVSVRMYESWRDTWENWPRTLPMQDQYARLSGLIGLTEVTLVQALPLPLTVLLWPFRRARPRVFALNGVLVAVRLGILWGTARAYAWRPWAYWLSPVCDVPVAIALWASLLRRRHVWRGHPIPLRHATKDEGRRTARSIAIHPGPYHVPVDLDLTRDPNELRPGHHSSR